MNSENFKHHIAADLAKLKTDFAQDARQEAAHIIDPAQCGVIVRKHFTALTIMLYLFVFTILAIGIAAIYLYFKR